MLRHLVLVAALLLVGGCGKAIELVNQTKTVAASREDVFAKMFGKDGSNFNDLPLVTNGGSTRLYELVLEKGDPQFEQIAPKERPETQKVKLTVSMEIPRETHLRYNIDDGAVTMGLKFSFEELEPGQTRVSFNIDDLAGHDTEGLTINTIEFHKFAREALEKLDDFEEVKEPA